MARLFSRFVPTLYKDVNNPSNLTGFVFRNRDYEAKIRVKGDKFEFWIEDTLVFSFNKDGIIDELGTGTFLPDQTGNDGKFLTTDGTTASWDDIPVGVGGTTDHAELTHLAYADAGHTGFVPDTRTVNGHALSSNVTVSKSDVGLGSVENTALSTWAGTSNITTLGTVATGTWNGTTVAITRGGTGQTTASGAINALLPTQSGHTGEFLTTNGTAASWSSISNADSRKAIYNVTAGSNAITYSSTLGTTNYILLIRCYDANGNNVNYTITAKTATGFSITVSTSATVEYLAELLN